MEPGPVQDASPPAEESAANYQQELLFSTLCKPLPKVFSALRQRHLQEEDWKNNTCRATALPRKEEYHCSAWHRMPAATMQAFLDG
jgi:hypothetical protein